MSPTVWRILAVVLAAGAVSVLLAPRTRSNSGRRPWRVDQADTAAAAAPAESAEIAENPRANVALH